MTERKSPTKSATLYKEGVKKTGNDGNIWIIQSNKNGVKKWVLYKKVSKKVSKKSSNKVSNKVFDNHFDLGVLETIRSYKSVYELIMQKSLEYKIEMTPLNLDNGITKVEYFKKGSYNTNSSKVDMHVVGFLIGNTFTWNSLQRKTHYYTFITTLMPLITNPNTLDTLHKLFATDVITFSEKYNQTIPYLLSYMYDPKKANIIKFVDSNDHFTYIFINMSLDIPYWYQITDHIIYEFNRNNYIGGSINTNNYTYRLLQDKSLAHKMNVKKN